MKRFSQNCKDNVSKPRRLFAFWSKFCCLGTSVPELLWMRSDQYCIRSILCLDSINGGQVWSQQFNSQQIRSARVGSGAVFSIQFNEFRYNCWTIWHLWNSQHKFMINVFLWAAQTCFHYKTELNHLQTNRNLIKLLILKYGFKLLKRFSMKSSNGQRCVRLAQYPDIIRGFASSCSYF